MKNTHYLVVKTSMHRKPTKLSQLGGYLGTYLVHKKIKTNEKKKSLNKKPHKNIHMAEKN